jgi:transposase
MHDGPAGRHGAGGHGRGNGLAAIDVRHVCHTAAFPILGKVPASILDDNTEIAVARIPGDGKRQRTRVFSELQAHHLFADRFGRPGKGNDKGKVEGLVGWIRRNYLVPIPRVASFAALNAKPIDDCRRRLPRRCRALPRRTWRPRS